MAQNKVELVITADDAKAAAAFTKLIEATRKAGAEADQTGKKGQSSFDSWAKGIMGMVTPLASVSGAVKVAMDMMDHLKEKIDAIREAQAKAAEVSKTYGESLGRIVVNIPGISTDQVKGIDAMLRQTAGSRGLGEGGLVKLGDAYAQIQSSIPLAPEAKKAEALQETAKLLELVPTENASGVALGVAKIMESSNWALNGTQALNLLRQQQTLGLVKDVGPIGQGIPTLGAAATMAQVGLPDMQALAAYMTQKMGDVAGPETFSAISGMVSKLMTRGAKLTDKLGGDVSIEGNLFERLQKISEVYQSGALDEEAIGKMLPDMTRSEKGKMAVLGLLGGGMGELNTYRSIMTSDQVLKGDFTKADLSTLREALPAQAAQADRRLLQSQGEARKAGNAEAAQEILEKERFEARMGRERRTSRYKVAANVAYDYLDVGMNMPDPVAAAGARIYATFQDQAGIGSKFGRIPINAPDAIADTLVQAVRELRDAVQDVRKNPAPRTPLGVGGLNR